MREAMDFDFKNSFARWYFYITPLFILLDHFLGINVRVSALETMPLYKNLYYGFCILCGICMYIIPRYSAVVALFESSINIIMLVLGIFLPYIRTITALMDDVLGADFTALEESLKVQPMVNLFIVGSCLILTFRKSIETIAESFGFDKQASKE
ncbi:MAG: hypothetical protein H8D56_10825 [Planctomycetes bacterium]|nr:hypothetical protein [Planctomycetota bacterium]MBL7143063.1 hypothetical protein [Phycisphaerae bacterium]